MNLGSPSSLLLSLSTDRAGYRNLISVYISISGFLMGRSIKSALRLISRLLVEVMFEIAICPSFLVIG